MAHFLPNENTLNQPSRTQSHRLKRIGVFVGFPLFAALP
jgi:hypothetical protein